MRRHLSLTTVAMCLLMASPALAQVERRDHRRTAPPPPPAERVPAERVPAKRAAPAPVVQGHSPAVGPAGTTVTIRGTFADDAVVVFGRQEVTPTKQTRRSITFDVPRTRPGSHRIVVKSAGGQADVGAFQIVAPSRGEPPEPPPGAIAPPPRQPPPPPPTTRVPARRSAPTVSGFRPRQGPGGTEVTIRGRNLSPDLQIMVGDREVQATRVTPTSITFTVPKRARGTETIVLRPNRGRDLVVGGFEVSQRRGPSRAELRKQRQAEAERQWRESQKTLPKAVPDRRAALLAYEEELRRTRAERRAERLAAIQAAWEQAFLAQPEVQAELTLHAERKARLARMLRLAETDDHGQLVIRIRVLMTTEDARHERRMADLRTAFQ
jgi:hypothetical protein